VPDTARAHEQVRKQVSVVFSSVGGSTTLGERLDSETLGQVMADYFQRMRRVLERYGATVEQFLGDTIVGVFGLPVLHEDDALRAVRAAAEMRDEVASLNEWLQRDWGVPIAVRTGVNTGTIIVGASTTGKAFITHEAVSLAVRLMQAAHPGEILLGEGTYKLVRHAVTVEPVPALVVEGRQEPLQAVRLTSTDPDLVGHPRLSSAMVGRDRDQNLLHEAFERVIRDRSCHLFTILGGVGVGKSRLVAEFVSAARERATILSGRCLPYGDGITLWPLIEVIRQAARIAEDAPADVVQGKLAEAMAGQEHGGQIVRRVAALLGIGDPAGAPEEQFWAVRKLAETVARRRPLVVHFDDLHWAEPTFLDLVEHVAEWSRDAPLLLVCSARPEFLDQRPNWAGGKLNTTTIMLEPLTEVESLRVIANLLGGTPPAGIHWAGVNQAAEGNPLFLEELVAMLIDDGVLRSQDGRWVPTADLSQVAVPPTINALLSARLEQLDPGDRTLVERAAVVGKVFYLGALALLTERDRAQLRADLGSLLRKDLIRPASSDLADEETFRFRHILIRDTAYDGLSRALRAELHERFATWLERSAAEREREYEEIVGYHLEKAYRYREELQLLDQRGHRLGRRALERLMRAGLRAADRGDMPAAVKLLSRAKALLDEDDPVTLDLSVKLGELLTQVGSFEQADGVLCEVLAKAAALGDDGLKAYALIERAFARISTETRETLARTLEEAQQAIELFEQLDDEQGLIRAWSLVAYISNTQGRLAGRQEASERSLAYARSAGDERAEAWASWGIIGALSQGPTPVTEGIPYAEEQLEWARARGRRWLEAGALMHLGLMQAMRGRFEQARDLITRSRAICDDLGLTVLAAAIAQLSGTLEQLAGDPAAAERELRRGYDALEALGETYYRSTVAAQLADALSAQERYEEAEAFAMASSAAASSEDVISQLLWRAAQAKVLARRGLAAEAEELARRALALAEGIDLPNMRGDVLLGLADVLCLSARRQEAIPYVEEALRLFQRKGNVVAARRARAWLGEHDLGGEEGAAS
jgi:class 3 adenylate cyclase/tetratricopeptide (TPR) repeat protein